MSAAIFERGGLWYEVPRPIPLAVVIRSALLNALAWSSGEQAGAAKALHISVRKLGYLMGTYRIPRPHAPLTNDHLVSHHKKGTRAA